MTPNGKPRCHADEIANARAHFADLRDGGNLPRQQPGIIRATACGLLIFALAYVGVHFVMMWGL